MLREGEAWDSVGFLVPVDLIVFQELETLLCLTCPFWVGLRGHGPSLESPHVRRGKGKDPQAHDGYGRDTHPRAWARGRVGGSPCSSGVGSVRWPSVPPLFPSPSYLYPDGKNHNPDLTELYQMEPHPYIRVSEVRSQPVPPHRPCPCSLPHPPHCASTQEFSPTESGLESQRPWVFVLVWWPCDLGSVTWPLCLCPFSGKYGSSCLLPRGFGEG